MEIELQDDLESIKFEVTDKNAITFIKSRMDIGKSFDVFFPDYEIKVE